MRVELHPEARAEFRSAALWYDAKRVGLGDAFTDEIAAALWRVGESPLAHPLWPGTAVTRTAIRKSVVDRFPYLIAFEVRPTDVLVLAVAHAKRKSLYWLARVGRGPG